MCRSKSSSFLLYASYARTHCCSSISTTGGNNPCRLSSVRSSSVKAVPLFKVGSDIKSFPDWCITIIDSGFSIDLLMPYWSIDDNNFLVPKAHHNQDL